MTALRLVTRTLGDGPPVVVLHGLLGQGRNWQTIARGLAERSRVLLVDLRNHGASPWDDTMTYAAMAADIAALIETESLVQPAVVGHSMGGKVAMALALRRPELVSRLAVVDIAPVTYKSSLFERYLRAMLAIDLERLTRRPEIDAALTEAVPEPGIRSFLISSLELRDGRMRWSPNLAVLLRALPEITGFPDELLELASDVPTLVLRGERSDYVLPQHEPTFRRLFPHAQIVTVPNAGHWVHAEAPQAVTENLTSFLNRNA